MERKTSNLHIDISYADISHEMSELSKKIPQSHKYVHFTKPFRNANKEDLISKPLAITPKYSIILEEEYLILHSQ